MNKKTYVDKVENHLKDISTYVPLNKSSIAAYIKINTKLCQKLVGLKMMTKKTAATISMNENKIANFYALIKTHKEDQPIRPIVNTRNSPGYALAQIVAGILKEARDTHKYNALNSSEAVDRIKEIFVLPDEKFFSLDIKSMFTNIPIDRAIHAVEKRQQQLGLNKLQMEVITDIIKFVCTTSTEIIFNKKVYKQIKGLRMGSSLSPILAEFVTDDMLDRALITIRSKLLIKYVDDILIIDTEENCEILFNNLNKADKDIKFELEKEKDNKINYLDFTIINEKELKIKWYQKSIASGRFLNYHSHHQTSTKWNTARAFIKTMLKNSSQCYHTEILEKAK